MIVVTGAAGFIGSAMVWKLNQTGVKDIILVDELGTNAKWKNIVGLDFLDFINRTTFLNELETSVYSKKIKAIIHLGANSSTTERDADHLLDNNFHYSLKLAEFAVKRGLRFIYASSAATYGNGDFGFDDEVEDISVFRPLNMYGYSKQLFDKTVIRNEMINEMVGIKFFNVYGPNEYHKDDMASVIYKSYHQIIETGRVKLFKSYREEFKDGEQVRDFIYVKDCVDVMEWFLKNEKVNGLYNLGTGKARTWKDLVTAVFNAMNLPVKIEYIEMPSDIRKAYQYRTEATMNKLKTAGYHLQFTQLEDGILDYVQNYLMTNNQYL